MAIDEVTIYLGEKCWCQVEVGMEDFVVPHSPPPREGPARGKQTSRLHLSRTGPKTIVGGGPLSLVGPWVALLRPR